MIVQMGGLSFILYLRIMILSLCDQMISRSRSPEISHSDISTATTKPTVIRIKYILLYYAVQTYARSNHQSPQFFLSTVPTLTYSCTNKLPHLHFRSPSHYFSILK